jgi:hypothetical protein
MAADAAGHAEMHDAIPFHSSSSLGIKNKDKKLKGSQTNVMVPWKRADL